MGGLHGTHAAVRPLGGIVVAVRVPLVKVGQRGSEWRTNRYATIVLDTRPLPCGVRT